MTEEALFLAIYSLIIVIILNNLKATTLNSRSIEIKPIRIVSTP